MVKTIGAKVEDETYEVFKLVCENEGVTPSDRLRDLVNKFVNEEAPFLVIDRNVCIELKRIAEERGVDWRELTCEAILKFCVKCSEKKEASEEKETESVRVVRESELEKASTEEKKPKERSILEILTGEEEGKEEASIEEKLEAVKIVRE